jgi:tRNA(Ile2) C34 agmatinyltransferase TiaS
MALAGEERTSMAYEAMRDSYKVYLYVKAICPKCGFLMHTYGADFRQVTCGNGRDCDMAGIILEAPSMEVKRFIAKAKPDALPPKRPASPSEQKHDRPGA